MSLSKTPLVCARMFARNIPRMRCFSSTSAAFQQPNQPNQNGKIKSYIMDSYLRFMDHYETKLEKRFPAAMKIYRVFSFGIKAFFKDLKSFVVVRLTVISLSESEGLKELTRKEIELYERMPKEMIKLTPVLILSAIPFSNYVVFPLAYMFPQKLLSSHFWTEEQKEEFSFVDLESRLENSKPVFKGLNQYIPDIIDSDLKHKWCDIITDINFGKQPSVERIVDCKHLFTYGPFSLRNLHFIHMKSLLHLHGLTLGLHPFSKLNQRFFLIKEMDNAIYREGGTEKMNTSEVTYACFLRGLHTCSLTSAESKQLLNNWIALSKNVEDDCVSLLLHGPVLLGYNIPTHFVKPKI